MRTKKIMLTLLSFMLVFILAFGAIGCSGGNNDNGENSAPTFVLDNSALTLYEDDEPTLLTATLDGNDVDKSKLTWTSSDNNIATVNNGYVYVGAVGNTKITCTYGEHVATCDVTVKELTNYIEISTASQLFSALTSGEDNAYKLVNDIRINDKTIDSSSSFQSGEYFFDADFKGFLNGNNKKLIFNLENRSLGKAFNGLFKSISGTIKKANIIVCVQSLYEKTGEYGIFTPLLTGRIDQCILTYDTYMSTTNVGGSVNCARTTPILKMGADAQISRTVIRRERVNAYYDYSRLCEYQLVKYAEPTSKITNVIIVGNRWGWTGNTTSTSQIRFALPIEKCQVDGFWCFETYGDAGVVTYLKPGKFTYRLDAEKYLDPSTPANVSKTGADITTPELEVLYSGQNPYNGVKYPEVSIFDKFGMDFLIDFVTIKFATYKSGEIDVVKEDADAGRIIIDFFY